MSLRRQLDTYLSSIYNTVPDVDVDHVVAQLLDSMCLSDSTSQPGDHNNLWSEQDIALITYGDTIVSGKEPPLVVLSRFLDKWVGDAITWLHILPFFPWTSDDGFAVMDYSSVNQALGTWEDIELLARRYKVMADLVLNHCSSRSIWFENFRAGRSPGSNYFFVADEAFDTSSVVRPRTSPLLQAVTTPDGDKDVWCTFSADQVDFDFRNPEVLVEFCRVIRLYLDRGVRIFRLDAVAFVWKRSGTSCINLPEAHELVAVLRLLIEHAAPDAVVITETNVPNIENLAYFGQGNEAHAIYNFALPPLMVHTLISGDSSRLSRWLMSMPPAFQGTTYFNFLASHDGIGLRPIEGILSDQERDRMIDTLQSFGALLSWKRDANGLESVYEINVSLLDALSGTERSGVDEFGLERFLLAHLIMLGLEGVPAIYIHSFLGTRNDHERVDNTGHNRAINRHQWSLDELESALDGEQSSHRQALEALKTMIEIRSKQPAFHPNATQYTLHLQREVFGFWRQSMDRRQSIFCLHNVSDTPQQIDSNRLNLVGTDHWYNLLSGDVISDESSVIELGPYESVWLSNR